MECPVCGAANLEGAQFCGLCHAKFAGTAPPPVSGPASAGAEPPVYVESAGPPAENLGAQSVPPATPDAYAQSTGPEAEPSFTQSPIYPDEAQARPLESILAEDRGPSSMYEVMPVPVQTSSARSSASSYFSRRVSPNPILTGAINKIAGADAGRGDTASLISMATIVALTGSIFMLVASRFLANIFTTSQVIFGGHLDSADIAGIIFGVGLHIAVTFSLGFIVGWKAMRSGALLGLVTSAILVAIQGLTYSLHLNAVADHLQKTASFLSTPGFPWMLFGISAVITFGTGVLGGWSGEYAHLNKSIGTWPFRKVAMVFGGGMAAVLLVLGLGGLAKQAFFKPSKGPVLHAITKMQNLASWEADIYPEGSPSPREVVQYERGKGYLAFVMRKGVLDYMKAEIDGFVYECDFDYRSMCYKWTMADPNDTVNLEMFDVEKLRRMELLKTGSGTFEGKDCACYSFESRESYALWSTGRSDMPLKALIKLDVWLDPTTKELAGMTIYRNKVLFRNMGTTSVDLPFISSSVSNSRP